MSDLRKDAQRMADAIRGFRNLALGKYTALRATPEYTELVYAWENYSDKLAAQRSGGER